MAALIKVRCSIGFKSSAPFPLSQPFSPATFLAICESDHPHLIDALQPVIKNMSGRKADTCSSRGPTARTPCLRCRHARARAPARARRLILVPYFASQEARSECRKTIAAAACIRVDCIISLNLHDALEIMHVSICYIFSMASYNIYTFGSMLK